MAPSPAPNRTKPFTRWHLGIALAATAAISALIGVGFGSAVRFRMLDTPSAQFLNPQQDFPPLPNWPTKAAVAPFDTPYFPGEDGTPANTNEEDYEPFEGEAFADGDTPLPANLESDDPFEDDSGYSEYPESEYPEYPEYPEDSEYSEDKDSVTGEEESDYADADAYSAEDFFPAAASDADKSHKIDMELAIPVTQKRRKAIPDGRKLSQF